MGDMEKPLVLDISNTAQIQNASTLLALDTQRANAQLAMTQILYRISKIYGTLKELYIEATKLLGTEETSAVARKMQWFAEQERRQHDLRIELGEGLPKLAIS